MSDRELNDAYGLITDLRAKIAMLEAEAAGRALMDAEGEAFLPEVVTQLQARIEALDFDLKDAYVMIGLCLTGHWPRPEAEALWTRLHDRYCEGSCDAARAAEEKP